MYFWSVPARTEANLYQPGLDSAFIPPAETSAGDHRMGARTDILQLQDPFQSVLGENHPSGKGDNKSRVTRWLK